MDEINRKIRYTLSMATKETILTTLKNASGFVSGEELAASCGVSRAAVWKAIRSLESEGWKIEAVQNRGYRLLSQPDVIDRNRIVEKLHELGCNVKNVFAFATIDSTNSEAKRRAAEVNAFRNSLGELTQKGRELHRTVFATDTQTAGRGRMGRPFVSPAGSGVYLTLLYAPRGGVKNPALLTAAAAVAVCRAIKKLYGLETQIKWVNDIFYNGKKVCGILTEGIANFETGIIEAAIVGLGINISGGESLPTVAGSLISSHTATASIPTRNEVIAQVVHEILTIYDAEEKENVQIPMQMIEEYQNRSLLTGREVMVNPTAGLKGKPYRVKVLSIDSEARLVVQCEDGTEQRLHSGEVSLHSENFVLSDLK